MNRFKIIALISTLLIGVNCISQHSPTIGVSNLKVEGRRDIDGIEHPHPRLSWQISSASRNIVQTGYQIIVAGSSKKIDQNIGDVWTSQKVNSASSVNVAYPLMNLS